MANPNQDARSTTKGTYRRTPETIARDAEAARLWGEGWTHREIGDHFGITKQSAWLAIQRAWRTLAEPARPALERRQQELDLLWESAMDVLENHHIVVSNGRVVELDGEPLRDDGPRLQAIAELRRINESRRKLEGTDQPAKVDVSGGVKYEVVGISPEDLT